MGNQVFSYERYWEVIDSLSNQFTRSIVLNTVTENSLGLILDFVNNMKGFSSSILAAFEEMGATNKSINDNLKKIDSQMNVIVEKNNSLGVRFNQRIEEIQSVFLQIQDSQNTFKSLIENSKIIFEATSTITNISDRTNVLAINASIEAAHAGKAGAGFNIISSEIRKLADQSKDLAGNISNLITDFQKNFELIRQTLTGISGIMEGLVTDIGDIKTNFNENNKTAREIGDSLDQITGSMDEQTAALGDGLKNIEQLSRYSTKTSSLTESLFTAYGDVSKILARYKA